MLQELKWAKEPVGTENQVKKLMAGLRIELSLELGTVEISLNDLLDLAPGQVFHYDFDPGRPIKLLAAGEEVAEGILVLENEQVFLEITTIKSKDEREEETFSATARINQ